MIRDPSDGSVKEIQATTAIARAPIDHPASVLAAGTSGLPEQKREDLERLNRLREWLKNRNAPKPE